MIYFIPMRGGLTMTHGYFMKHLSDCFCRRCINRYYGISLTPDDCKYRYYTGKCLACLRPRNIVMDVKLSGRVKLLKAKKERIPQRCFAENEK